MPHPQEIRKERKLLPFVSTTRPTWMILIRFIIHAKVFFSITLISKFLLRKSIPDLISNNYSLSLMIKMQQICSTSKFLSPITVKCFYFVVAFIFAIQPFPKISLSTTIRPSPVMSIFPPTLSPRSTMSGWEKLLFALQPELL